MNFSKTFYTIFITCILYTGIVSTALANSSIDIRPKGCDRMNVMNISSTLKLTSSSTKCIKYVVKNGGNFHFDVFATDTTVILVQPGGRLTSEEDVFAIINLGGEVRILDGTITNLRSEAGTTKVTSEADITSQSGEASVELDNRIKTK